MSDTDLTPRERWWVIAESELLAALRRVHDGQDPDLTLVELLANSDTEQHPRD